MGKKSILILVDGMRRDALEACGHPFVQEILKTGAVRLAARCVMPSVTLPCHISLFHSVPPQRHGTLTNDYTQQVRPVRSLPEQLHLLEKSTAMFYSWEQLRDIALPGNMDYSLFMNLHRHEHSDVCLTDAALSYIDAEKPDFVFLYLGQTDETGHGKGWMGEEYLQTVYTAWDCIERVARKTQGEYDLFITADHGGHERCHGTEMPEDMNIPLFVRTVDSLPVKPRLQREGEPEGKQQASIMDIAPTIATVMGIPLPRDWEGESLV